MRWLQLFVVIATACAPTGRTNQVPARPRAPVALDAHGYLAALATGDQRAFERWVRATWTPAALAESDAADRASWMARTYTDTGGFDAEGIAGEQPGWVQLRVRARRTQIEYCVTARRDGDRISDVVTSELYPAGSDLADPEPVEVVDRIRRLAEAYDRAGDFSGQVLVARHGKVHFRGAYGMTDMAQGQPVTLMTRFSGASIGKSLTAVAIAQLVQAGKLGFDDPVGKALPDYPDSDVRDHVTIRHLLTHTSGMGPNDYYDDPRWPAMRRGLRTVDDYLRLVVGKPLGARPGERYEYSNAGYIVLGAVIERLSGQQFHDYVRDHIFAPAGMTRSSYPDGPAPDLATPLTNLVPIGGLRYRYTLGVRRSAIVELAARGGPAGGAVFTADDLLAFEHALLAGKLIEMQLTEQLFAPTVEVGGRRGTQDGVYAGLGFEITRRNGHTMIGHNGGDLGIAAFLYRFPETGYTVIVLSNLDPRAVRVMLSAMRGLITRRTRSAAIPSARDCVAPT